MGQGPARPVTRKTPFLAEVILKRRYGMEEQDVFSFLANIYGPLEELVMTSEAEDPEKISEESST